MCMTKKNICKNLLRYSSVIAGISAGSVCLAAGADPLADSLKPQIAAMFGAGSTVSYAIYTAEMIAGAVGYIKSKNPLILVGVPILVMFTHGMFTYISS